MCWKQVLTMQYWKACTFPRAHFVKVLLMLYLQVWPPHWHEPLLQYDNGPWTLESIAEQDSRAYTASRACQHHHHRRRIHNCNPKWHIGTLRSFAFIICQSWDLKKGEGLSVAFLPAASSFWKLGMTQHRTVGAWARSPSAECGIWST